jgi:methylated-DNA-[protein]-cysteine S-methyltransferase
MPRHAFHTAFGHCAISWGDAGLTRFELPETASRAGDSTELPPEIIALAGRVRAHLSGRLQDFSDLSYQFSLVPVFARDVYRATLAVKPGQTRTYGEIAAALGQPPGVSRAVGAALGANPWPLLVPCHRVVAAGGKMTGFSGPGGITTKLRLLALEGAEMFPV